MSHSPGVERALGLIRLIDDYPMPGILFQDITPVLADAHAFKSVIEAISEYAEGTELVVGVEARGFILGSAIALHRNLPFIPIRKKGKLPHDVITESYGLEYGHDQIEIHRDAVSPGQTVVLIDDVLATGGTLVASIKLIERLGGIVTEIALLSEISELKGRDLIHSQYPNVRIRSLLS